jgi:hypothetical protein
MLKCNKKGWSVAWGNRNFLIDTLGIMTVYSACPPIFERKRDAQMFMDIKIDQFKKHGWLNEKDLENIRLVRVKLSVELA